MNLLDNLRPFRAFDLVPLAGTLSLLGALWHLSQPDYIGGGWGIPSSDILGAAFAVAASHFLAVSLTDRRAAVAMTAGLALTAVLGLLELMIWPPHPDLLEVPGALEEGYTASHGAWVVILVASIYAFAGAWRSRSASASLLAAATLASLHLVLLETFVARSQTEITRLDFTGYMPLLLFSSTLALALLPWPGRSLRFLPGIALLLALMALNGVYSESHWPGGYLLPGLPFGSRSGAGVAGVSEWSFRLLLLAIALSITALRLAWRRWARRGGAAA